MSYTITQQPDAVNLSRQMKDLIINTTDDVVVKISVDTTIVLEETYTPDADGNVYVRRLGQMLEDYLGGAFDKSPQTGVTLDFTIEVDSDEIDTYTIISCRAYSAIEAAEFLEGNVFMHILKQRKWVSTTSKEYLTCALTNTNNHKVQVFITTFDGNDYTNSDPVDFATSLNDEIITFDASFEAVKAKFQSADPDTIVAYRFKLPKEIAVFMVDRAPYILMLQFRYLNSFSVPDTLLTRGPVSRRGETKYVTANINDAEVKFNTRRSDTFTVDSGKIFSLNEYDRYREMLNSDDVEIFFMGEWKKIIIYEENFITNLRSGSMDPITFSFRFADEINNALITGEAFIRWILENGVWTDGNMWVDTGEWNDIPD